MNPRRWCVALGALAMVACSGGGGGGSSNHDAGGQGGMGGSPAPNDAGPHGGSGGMGGTGGHAGGTGGMGGMGGMPFTGVALAVPDAARACEAVVRDPAGVLAKVTFGQGVQGHSLAKGERRALAFVAGGDAAIPLGAVSLEVRGDAASLEIASSRCFDNHSAELPGAHVEIHR